KGFPAPAAGGGGGGSFTGFADFGSLPLPFFPLRSPRSPFADFELAVPSATTASAEATSGSAVSAAGGVAVGAAAPAGPSRAPGPRRAARAGSVVTDAGTASPRPSCGAETAAVTSGDAGDDGRVAIDTSATRSEAAAMPHGTKRRRSAPR